MAAIKALAENALSAALRPMNSGDVAAVAAIEQQVQFTPWSATLFADTLRVPRYFGYVLMQAQQLLGFYIVEVIADEATLHNIAVSPEHQSKGFGRQLIEHAIGQCLQTGVTRLMLEVRESNTSAIGLYESLGFELDGVRRDYYSAPWGRENGLLMSRPLS
ncbi:ribosomal protein S18-alanine N-acetyltransferase [Neiella sp. HB171785]|uniref:[Ribosomal protein bS18]-alanine N-acetyltransferase n=1 Tax=Neiella litorisoli TaxID=2771431 RepID=A0A8J6QIB9_9GAMM|nr:ribosomal protein S18-alanine N-acetyltransferase [Neiella litorisoli]MBD1390500.1 ribosomal protein S18-alanine N-acetyltransferase [Neiella litorisoli]